MMPRLISSFSMFGALLAATALSLGCTETSGTPGGSGGSGGGGGGGGNHPNACGWTTPASCSLQIGLSSFTDPAHGPPQAAISGLGNGLVLANGDIVAERHQSAHGYEVTTIWRFEHGGSAWHEVDDPASSPNDVYTGFGLTLAPDGGIFATGNHAALSQGQAVPGRGTVRRSEDGGTTWKEVLSVAAGGEGLFVSSVCSLYAGFADGIRTSADGGDTWKLAFEGQPLSMVALDDGSLVATISTMTDTLQVAHGSGSGAWQHGSTLHFPGTLASDGTAVYALEAIDFPGQPQGGWKVRKSDDQGGSWTDLETYHGEVNPPAQCASGGSLEPEMPAEIVVTRTGTIVVSGSAEMNDVCDGYEVLRRSDDGGQTWKSELPAGSGGETAPELRLLSDGSIEVAAYGSPTSRFACE
jgi:hypothetical protein